MARTTIHAAHCGPGCAAALWLAVGLPGQAGNSAPKVWAGPPATVGLFESLALDGAAADDGLPSAPGMLSIRWSLSSGPGSVTFANSNAAQTSARFSTPGAYVLELKADDGQLTGSATIPVTVLATSLIRVPQDKPTIQAGINAAKNRDLVLVSPGLYKENVVLAGKTVTLASLLLTTGNPQYVAQTVIDGGGKTVITVGKSVGPETVIQGFTIQNGPDGISAQARLFILNNRFTATGDAIDYESGGGVCRGNTFENNSDDGIDLDGASAAIIEDNLIRDNGDDGIEIRLHSYTGPTLAIVIRDNLISGNLEDGIQLIDYPGLSSRSFLIENNVLVGNALVGLGLMDGGNSVEDFRAASIPEPIHLFRNTFSGNDHGLTGGDNLVALDNLFVGHTTLGIKGVNGRSIAAFNLFWNNAKHYQSSVVHLLTTLIADPLLDPELRLQPGSPAIEAGTPIFVWGNEKLLRLPGSAFNGPAPDLGAHEVNRPPLVDAGPDLTIALSAGAVTLSGIVFDDQLPDPPGQVKTTWSQVSGPGSAVFTDPVSTIGAVTLPAPGIYVLRLSADDGQLRARDEVQITAL